jgi:hypothetical protein
MLLKVLSIQAMMQSASMPCGEQRINQGKLPTHTKDAEIIAFSSIFTFITSTIFTNTSLILL